MKIDTHRIQAESMNKVPIMLKIMVTPQVPDHRIIENTPNSEKKNVSPTRR